MEQARTFALRAGVHSGFAVRARVALWALVAVAFSAVVGVLQTQHRAPLSWDEAVRVRAGQEFVFAVRAGGLAACWQWVNEQVFYGFVAPLMHGVVLLFVDDPVVAGWAPSLAAYTALGLLAGALARELQFGSTAAWIAALLCWSTPLYARLASGGFVDNLGACASVATVLFLVRSLRTARVRDGVLAGVGSVCAFLIRYELGLVLIGTIAATSALAAVHRNSPATLKTLGIACATSLVLSELWFIPNASLKWAGFSAFFNLGGNLTGVTRLSLENWTYYPSALWYNQELGLSSLVADGLIVAMVWGAITAVRSPRLAVLLVFAGGWYVFYAAAGGAAARAARYLAPVLPLGFVLLGAVSMSAVAAVRRLPVDRPAARTLRWVTALVLALELGRQVAGPTGIGQQWGFVQTDPPAAEIAEFLSTNLGSGESSLLFLGETTEVSPDLVRLDWMRGAGHPGQRVVTTADVKPDPRGGTLYDQLRLEHIELVLAVRVGPDSRFDSPDFRARFERQAGYERYADELNGSTKFKPVAQLGVDAGRMDVLLWRIAQAD